MPPTPFVSQNFQLLEPDIRRLRSFAQIAQHLAFTDELFVGHLAGADSEFFDGFGFRFETYASEHVSSEEAGTQLPPSSDAREPHLRPIVVRFLTRKPTRNPTVNAVFNYGLDGGYAEGGIAYKVPTRVLIADDSELIRGLIRRFLEMKTDVEVCGETADGQQTIDAAMALSPDLLILDVVMPKLNGIEVASVLKKNLPKTKTIAFTMYGDYVKNAALAAGVSVIVSKPDGILALLQAVEALLDKQESGSGLA